jgi:hypothetical protein
MAAVELRIGAQPTTIFGGCWNAGDGSHRLAAEQLAERRVDHRASFGNAVGATGDVAEWRVEDAQLAALQVGEFEPIVFDREVQVGAAGHEDGASLDRREGARQVAAVQRVVGNVGALPTVERTQQSSKLTRGKREPPWVGWLLGEEDSPLPNKLGMITNQRAGSRARPGATSGKFSRWVPV